MLERVDLGEVAHDDAAQRMRDWVTERQAGTAGDRLFLLSHPPVITYGPRTAAADLPAELGIPTVPVDRGGYATYHGPGQLVGYLIVNVRERGPADIVRWLEDGLLAALGKLGFAAVRRETPPGASSLVGVWTSLNGICCPAVWVVATTPSDTGSRLFCIARSRPSACGSGTA